MELKLLYLCDGPYHSVLFQTHLWLGILYSFYCKSLEAEELLFHSVLYPSFLALSSPAFFHILPFFCIFEEGDMLFLYYLESSVCAHTPPHTLSTISCSSFSSDSISQGSFCGHSRPEQAVLFYTLTDPLFFLPSSCMWLFVSLSLCQ